MFTSYFMCIFQILIKLCFSKETERKIYDGRNTKKLGDQSREKLEHKLRVQ